MHSSLSLPTKSDRETKKRSSSLVKVEILILLRDYHTVFFYSDIFRITSRQFPCLDAFLHSRHLRCLADDVLIILQRNCKKISLEKHLGLKCKLIDDYRRAMAIKK